MWPIAYPFLVILLVALIDSNVKGRAMARYGWDALPDWLRDRGVFAWRTVLAVLLGLLCLLPSLPSIWSASGFSMNWRPCIALLILGSCGVESVLYWYLLRPLGIRQRAHWIVRPDWMDYQYPNPPVSWFQYPPAAPWLWPLPGFWYLIPPWFRKEDRECPTRREVYTVAAVGVVLALLVQGV